MYVCSALYQFLSYNCLTVCFCATTEKKKLYPILNTTPIDVISFNYQFHLADRHPAFGSALHIKLPQPVVNKEKQFDITIKYTTTERCTALQFLEPEYAD